MSQKTKDKIDLAVNDHHNRLLELQDQRDLYRHCTDRVWKRCADIKSVIKQESDLETLRQEMSQRVREKFAGDDAFWEKKFNVRSSKQSADALPVTADE